jgi:hypothetical protein
MRLESNDDVNNQKARMFVNLSLNIHDNIILVSFVFTAWNLEVMLK